MHPLLAHCALTSGRVHGEQAVRPAALAYFPGGHAEHTTPWPMLLAKPGRHGRHRPPRTSLPGPHVKDGCTDDDDDDELHRLAPV